MPVALIKELFDKSLVGSYERDRDVRFREELYRVKRKALPSLTLFVSRKVRRWLVTRCIL